MLVIKQNYKTEKYLPFNIKLGNSDSGNRYFSNIIKHK